jgi:hypothetical protein
MAVRVTISETESMTLATVFAVSIAIASIAGAGAGVAAADGIHANPADGIPTCKTADPRVEAVVAARVHDMHGDEYCQARLYHTLDDLDGDGHEDFVVVFAVEARDGNRTVQYLAVFPSRGGWKPVVLKVGERGQRYVEQIEVQPGHTLVLRTSEYTPSDAMCCPSGKGELKYHLDRGHLTTTDGTPIATATPPLQNNAPASAPTRHQ